MRTLEALLLLVNLLTFCWLVIPQLHTVRSMRYAAPAGFVVAGVQALVEGPRWQMVPAYALTTLFLLIWLYRRIRAPAHQRSRPARLTSAAAAVPGFLVLLVSSALPILVPVFRFPQPSGPYAIGTVTYHWIDSSRVEVFAGAPSDRRELMVQIWYPAKGKPSGPGAPYVEHTKALEPLARLFGLPRFIFGHLKYVTTNAITSATAAAGRLPVLLFAHGRGGYRQHNTLQVEELVSRGYVVAAMDQPGAASGVVFPDGRLAPFDPRMFDPSHPGHPTFLDSVIPFLAKDASFALDRLAAVDRADPHGILTGRLDLDHVGMFGVSLGGAVTAEACRVDLRLKACVIMDAFMPANVIQAGLEQPTMWISRDAGSMELEGWKQRDIDETQIGMRTVLGKLPQEGYLLLVPGTFHPNFSDLPLFSPLTRSLGLTGPIDADRAHSIINAFSVGFFDRELRGRDDALPDRLAERFPEALLDRHKASQQANSAERHAPR